MTDALEWLTVILTSGEDNTRMESVLCLTGRSSRETCVYKSQVINLGSTDRKPGQGRFVVL